MNQISERKVKELINELKELSSLKDSKRNPKYWYQQKFNILNANHISPDLVKEFLDEYSKVKRNCKFTEEINTDDRAVTNVERDEDGLILYYTFEIYRKDSPTLIGKLDRKEMETIYRLYSIYGANLTQKIVSREFPQYTFIEFKRILRAFNIYKANSEFAPHMIEERTEEELINLHNQNKENNVLRRVEKDQLAEANKLINKLAKENLDLKRNSTEFHFVEDVKIKPIEIVDKGDSDKDLILHLSDLHIGACLESGSLYNNDWNEAELERRLNAIVDCVEDLGLFNTIIVNMLGDYLDGMDNMTARRDHFMPQNMDNREQFKVFIRQMLSFLVKLSYCANNLTVFAVPEGNHDGISGYMAIKALEYAATKKLPSMNFTVFERFFGHYQFNGETYLIMHGKDAKFMKKPLPLNLNDKAESIIRDWLDREQLYEDNIHIIKGDLHTNNLNTCRKFEYRNVLSLFGDSDYSQYNFTSNAYGVSYDLFINGVRTIGTFENLQYE